MASLEEFRQLLKENPDKAMTDYVVHISQTLDGKAGVNDVIQNNAFGEQGVVFEFVVPNVILMRAKKDNEQADNTLWYLPWVSKGAAKADLGQDGSPYFSTSQLNGCRFTIQYADRTKKQATVLHLAGDFDFKGGSQEREDLESAEIGPVSDPKLRRRYSIGQSKLQGAKARRIVGDETRIYYGGNKASIFGCRDDNGAWEFWAQEMDEKYDRPDIGMGVRDLK